MNTNTDITIFNKWYNPEKRLDEWHRTQISGVNWYGGQSVTVGDKGLMTADTYKVRIPLASAPDGKTFVCSNKYKSKAKDALAGCWTLQNGDCIARGLIDTDITQLKEIAAEYFIITGWSDNRRGSPYTQHWKIDGK